MKSLGKNRKKIVDWVETDSADILDWKKAKRTVFPNLKRGHSKDTKEIGVKK